MSDVEARYEAFLDGNRPDDILIYLHEDGVGSIDDLAEIGIRTEDGVVLVLPGEQGRSAFQRATGLDAMDFAGMAMDTDGEIAADCTGGECPDGDGSDDHYAKFVFAFVEDKTTLWAVSTPRATCVTAMRPVPVGRPIRRNRFSTGRSSEAPTES